MLILSNILLYFNTYAQYFARSLITNCKHVKVMGLNGIKPCMHNQSTRLNSRKPKRPKVNFTLGNKPRLYV